MNIIDKNKNSYNIQSLIGEGAQGKTYLLENGGFIAKLFSNIKNETTLKSTISFLTRLGLDKECFAIPIVEVCQPRIGYISEFASGMISLTSLKWTNQTNDLQTWFTESGGLYRRYRILMKLAERMRTLHSKGLVYCDLSPNNVFISAEANKDHVLLIDLDNLTYKTSNYKNIYTPFYAAPEIVSSNSANSMGSDCFSFAIIAYELLTLSHPFIGDYVSEGDPELEEDALNGKLPWVDDSNDDINARTSGIPSSFFITKDMMNLFRRTFEIGLNEISQRPTAAEWYTALTKALNELIKCPNCNSHYILSNQYECPFCSYKSSSVVCLQIKRWEELMTYDKENNAVISKFQLLEHVYEEIFVDAKTSKYITASHLLLPGDPNRPILKIKVIESTGDSRLVEIVPLAECSYYIALNAEEIFTSNKPKKIRITNTGHKELIVGVNKLDIPQRIVTIK